MTVFKRASNGFTLAISLLILSLIISSGCAPRETVKEKTEADVLRERVMAYWDYKIKGDLDKSYEYEHPLYRKQVSMVKYIQGIKSNVVQWLDASVKELQIQGDSATVDIDLKTRVMLPQVKSFINNSAIQEKWVRVDGVWYHVPARFSENQ